MNKYIYLIAGVLTLLGCSKESPMSDHIILSDGFDKNGVRTNLNKEEFIFDRYYTKVSTISDKVHLTPYVDVLYDDGASISVRWTLNGSDVANKDVRCDWNADKQKWQSLNHPALDLEAELDFGDTFTSTIRFSNDKTITYEQSISENKIFRDVLGVNFGMTKEEVIHNELERTKGTECTEYQPSTLTLPISPHIDGGFVIYRFKENKLVEVGEYTTTLGWINSETEEKELNHFVVDYCKTIGLTEDPAIGTDDNLTKEYMWSNSQILFTLSIINDAPSSSPRSKTNTQKAFGLSYKLK